MTTQPVQTQPVSTPSSPAPAARQPRPGSIPWFYSAAALLVAVLTVVGFRDFYLHGKAYPGREITPPIRWLVITHGLSMSLWILLLIAQPPLILSRNHRLHMTLGRIGAGLAAVIVVVGFATSTRSAAVTPMDVTFGPLNPRQFMAVPYAAMIMFALYVGIGVWQRRRPEIHRPMMFLATLGALTAALDRIDFLRNLYVSTIFYRIWGPFFSALAIGLLLLGLKCAIARSFDRWFALGLGGLILFFGVMYQLAPTSLWASFTNLVIG